MPVLQRIPADAGKREFCVLLDFQKPPTPPTLGEVLELAVYHTPPPTIDVFGQLYVARARCPGKGCLRARANCTECVLEQEAAVDAVALGVAGTPNWPRELSSAIAAFL